MILKTDKVDYMKREVTAYIINVEKDLFLLGRETIEWR